MNPHARCLVWGALMSVAILASPGLASLCEGHIPSESTKSRAAIIPILGTSLDEQGRPVGVVAYLLLAMRDRRDREGLDVSFESQPGRFSARAQIAVWLGIRNAAKAAGMSSDSWAVTLSVPYPQTTVYGESLSAMVGLAVVAWARGDPLPSDRVITGTVEPNGRIGSVGGVPLKVEAAHEHHLRRVLVPDAHDVTDGDWETPFLMHVSPVGTVYKAYQALTDRLLKSAEERRE